MTRLQAFALTFLLLLIQTCFLIVSGYKLGGQYAVPALLLFALVDFLLFVMGMLLKVVYMEKEDV